MKGKRILIVDDNALNRELLEGMLENLGHDSEIAESGEQAIKMLSHDFDLVLLDVMMPGIDGFETAKRIRVNKEMNGIPIIMVTALGDKESRLKAVEAGANDFISKPVDITELNVRSQAQLKIKEAQETIKNHNQILEETVQRRTMELRHALTDLSKEQERTHDAHLDTIVRLSTAAEYKDEDTAIHIHRMSRYCGLLAESVGLPNDEVELIMRSSPMHDVGKIGIPDAILLKPGKLTDQEWVIMRSHTTIGARILAGSENELLQAGNIIAMSHHERMDGAGYPNGLAGEDIHLWGRICAVSDVFDALTSNRPYKEAFPNEKAFEILRAGRGDHFDPHILDVFFDRLDDVLAIKQKYQD
jgi:putative two-component system response regulator